MSDRPVADIRRDIEQAEKRLLREMTIDARRALNVLQLELYRVQKNERIRTSTRRSGPQPVEIPYSALTSQQRNSFYIH